MKGQVFRVISGFYDIFFENKMYRVRGSGNMRNNETSPVVGDFVEFEPGKFITEILERKNFLVRPKVANIDQAAIVMSLIEPNYSSLLLNKFLAIIEHQNIYPIIIFTKSDLTDETHLKEYTDQGYEAYEISNNNLSSLDQLKDKFTNKLTVFTGQTGVGKSSTIANLANVFRETQAISKALGRGKHTTRVVEIIEWNDGLLIDTPGFSSLDIELSPRELSKSFHDFKKASASCKFNDCLHYHEKICGVKDMVKKHQISKKRYEDYLQLLKGVLDE